MVSLDVAGGADSDGNKDAIIWDGIIAFLDGLYVRDKLDLTVLVKFQTTASDDAFGADRARLPIFSSDGVIPKDGNKDYINCECNRKLLGWSLGESRMKKSLVAT